MYFKLKPFGQRFNSQSGKIAFKPTAKHSSVPCQLNIVNLNIFLSVCRL